MFVSLLLGIIATATGSKSLKEIPYVMGVLTFVIFGVINFLFMPTLRLWGFNWIWVEITLATLIGLIAAAYDNDEDFFRMWQAIPLGICLLLFLVRCGSSTAIIHSERYANLLSPEIVEDSSFRENVHPIPVEKMISIKKAYAEDLASKRIENLPSLGSRCEFGAADMINLNGTLNFKTPEGEEMSETFHNEKVWVMPLEHRGFWKWMSNDVTDGYCIVSAHNPSRIFFVTELNGKPLKLRYLNSGFFGDYIKRHVRTNGYASCGLTDYSIELDDNGNPFWVISVYNPTIGFSGDEITGVIIVDVQTGSIEEYSIEDAPQWVDLIQPKDIVIDQINDWGRYQDGWWNSILAQNGVREATPGMSLVYSEGRSYWYCGIQSAGADKSSSGFMLIDTRTKECKLYPVAGINEQAAQEVIEAQSEWVRQSKFVANDPVLYNVHGIPTYYMTLTGDGIKNAGYAFVSMESELDFAAASTPQKALQAYLKVLQRSDQFKITDGDEIANNLCTMTVRDITCEDGIYYLLFHEVKGKEFIGSTDAFPELKWTKAGQKVNVSYTETKADIISLNMFDIVDFEI